MTLPKLTLVLGGVSSGKSAFAERLVLSAAEHPVYLATARIQDDEMAEKAAAHAARRGTNWDVIELSGDLGPALSGVAADRTILLDCATMWLMGWFDDNQAEAKAPDAFSDALAECPARLVVVSNEIGLGGVAADSLTRRFARAQGVLNQRVAARAELVISVMAGLPLCLKGQLP